MRSTLPTNNNSSDPRTAKTNEVKLNPVTPTPKIEFAKQERVDKQYYVDFKTTMKEVKNLILIAKEFNSGLYDFIDRITGKEVNNFRENLRKMLK